MAGRGDATEVAKPRDTTFRRERAIRIATCVVLTLPFAVEAVRALTVRGGYATASDLSIIELRLRDIPRHAPLTGVFSRYGWNHPGPLPYWVLVPFYWLSGRHPVGLVLGALAVNAAAVTGIVLVVRRRGGIALMAWCATLLALFVRAFGPDHWASAWNPYISVLPFAFFLVLAWSIAVGDFALLPLFAGAMSFAVASHVGYVPVVAAVTVVAIGGAWRSRRDGSATPIARPTVLWTIAVLVFAWWGPVLDVLLHRGGNVRVLVRYFRAAKDRVGWHSALRVMSNELSIHAQWLRGLVRDPFTAEPASIYKPTFPLLLVALVVAGAVAVWRRPRATGALFTIVVAAIVVGTASIASITGTAYDYLSMWALAVGFLTLLCVGAVAVGPTRAHGSRALVAATGSLLALGLGVSAAAAVDAARSTEPSDPGAHLVDAAATALARRADLRTTTITFSPLSGLIAGLATDGLILETERRGLHPVVAPSEGFIFGAHRTGDVTRARHFVVSVAFTVAEIPRAGPRRVRVFTADDLTPSQRHRFDTYTRRFEDLISRRQFRAAARLGPAPKRGVILTIYEVR